MAGGHPGQSLNLNHSAGMVKHGFSRSLSHGGIACTVVIGVLIAKIDRNIELMAMINKYFIVW